MAKIWQKHFMDVGSLNTFFVGGGRGGGMILSKKTKIGIEFNYSNQAQKKNGVGVKETTSRIYLTTKNI